MAYYGTESEAECGCYTAYPLPWCIGTLVIPQLNLGATYKAVIEDHFGNMFEVVGIASNGRIATDVLVDGLLNPFAGSYKMKVYNEADLDTPFNFTFNGKTYNCLLLTFKDIEPVPTSAEIR